MWAAEICESLVTWRFEVLPLVLLRIDTMQIREEASQYTCPCLALLSCLGRRHCRHWTMQVFLYLGARSHIYCFPWKFLKFLLYCTHLFPSSRSVMHCMLMNSCCAADRYPRLSDSMSCGSSQLAQVPSRRDSQVFKISIHHGSICSMGYGHANCWFQSSVSVDQGNTLILGSRTRGYRGKNSCLWK